MEKQPVPLVIVKEIEDMNNIGYSVKDITERLIKKKWSITTSKEKVFITSDRPVTFYNPKTGLLGIESKGVEIFLPLSPTKYLMLEVKIWKKFLLKLTIIMSRLNR